MKVYSQFDYTQPIYIMKFALKKNIFSSFTLHIKSHFKGQQTFCFGVNIFLVWLMLLIRLCSVNIILSFQINRNFFVGMNDVIDLLLLCHTIISNKQKKKRIINYIIKSSLAIKRNSHKLELHNRILNSIKQNHSSHLWQIPFEFL